MLCLHPPLQSSGTLESLLLSDAEAAAMQSEFWSPGSHPVPAIPTAQPVVSYAAPVVLEPADAVPNLTPANLL